MSLCRFFQSLRRWKLFQENSSPCKLNKRCSKHLLDKASQRRLTVDNADISHKNTTHSSLSVFLNTHRKQMLPLSQKIPSSLFYKLTAQQVETYMAFVYPGKPLCTGEQVILNQSDLLNSSCLANKALLCSSWSHRELLPSNEKPALAQWPVMQQL